MTEMNNLDFYRSIPLLVSNADKILSDPRKAFAKVPSGKILGVYLQWWKEHPGESHDYNGNPLVVVHGNWYSGSGYIYALVLTVTVRRSGSRCII